VYKASAKIEIEKYRVWTQAYHPLFVLQTCHERTDKGLTAVNKTIKLHLVTS